MDRKSSNYLILFAVMTLVCLTAGIATAAPVTQSITYQGKLTNAAGSPLTGTYSVIFKIYDASTGGTTLSTDTHSVTATSGLFTTSIAVTDPKVVDGRILWLGITVGADPEMTPRQEIRPVPYTLSLRPGAWITGAGTSPAMNLQGTGGGIAMNASTTGENGPAVRGESSQGVGIYGIGKEGGSFSTNQAGTGSVVLPAVNVSSVFDRTYGIRINTSAGQSRGIYITTSGGLSDGIISITKSYTSHGIVVSTQGESSSGVRALTAGEGSSGLYAETQGNKSHGLFTWTFGDDSHGVVARVFGPGSIGVYGESKYSPGVFGKSTMMDGVTGGSTDLYGVSGYSTNNAGVYGTGATAGVVGESMDGPGVSGRSTNYPGVFGYGKEGGYFWANTAGTSNNPLAGIHVITNKSYNYGVLARTMLDHSNGVDAHTQGQYSYGVVASTTGYESEGVVASTTGQYSDGVYAYTTGYGSAAVAARAYGLYSQGVYAYSEQSRALEGDTNNANHEWGVYTEDYIYGGGIRAPDVDVAEYMPVAGDVPPGTVLVIGPEGKLQAAATAYDPRVAGIVSTQPAIALGTKPGGNKGEEIVAISGRVPCRVDAVYGAIHPGDLLSTSNTPGHAMKAEPTIISGRGFYPDGTILGKAMGTLESGTGTIEVLVTLQ